VNHDDDFYRREAEDIGREHADRDRARDADRPRVVNFENAELDGKALSDAVDVKSEGQAIAHAGIKYLVPGLIPNYGMLGMLIAYAKTGKTTLAQVMGAAIATGTDFLDLTTTPARVLVICAEDPSEYVAFLARNLPLDVRGRMTFYRKSHVLNPLGLAQIVGTVRKGKYGFVLAASWQALIRGLVRDENDNAGMARVVEEVKAATRTSGVPWLIDAHSGKGEDQSDEADPSKALRGASAAAGAADYALWLRYANGAFGTQRRLSGKGRFVNLAPLTIDYDLASGTYTLLDASGKDAMRETTWRLIVETGALDGTPRTVDEIAMLSGLVPDSKKPNGTSRRRVRDALHGRPEVGILQTLRRGRKTTLYRRLDGEE
jgi:hypothetical protein